MATPVETAGHPYNFYSASQSVLQRINVIVADCSIHHGYLSCYSPLYCCMVVRLIVLMVNYLTATAEAAVRDYSPNSNQREFEAVCETDPDSHV